MRTVLNFNSKWAFSKETCEIPSEMPQNWIWVDLPHTWNAIDGQDGGNDYYRGRCLYAKSFSLADLPQSEKYYLELCGANSSADVYLNGKLLKHHDGGYSAWRTNMTGAIKNENLLVVAVDNSPNERVYPQTADFTFYGGLYRAVNIICVPETHFELDGGGDGIKITPRIKENDATIEIEAKVCGKNYEKLRYTVTGSDGSIVAVSETGELHTAPVIKNVRRWHGKRDPYLYTLRAELFTNGKAADTVTVRFGCRTFAVDSERGFILNGEEYALRGVSRHQDRKGVGNALTREHHREDMELIRELGATTLRLAHYQHDRYFYDLCDEYGIVVWAEIPYISRHMPEGKSNTVSQMKELIEQNYNHPSIVVWGLSNEITMNGDADADMLENHRTLNELCHKEDGTRLTAVAVLSPCPTDSPYLKIPDLVSYNHYFGWYGGDVSMNGTWFDKFHAEHPDIPIGCSEYGCEALDWHTSSPTQGDYTEEYQAYYHEELIKQLFSRKYLWATHVWNMFDFGADARCEGGENGQNHKGLVTFDRKYKKDAFYAYKAWLSDEPFVHICGKRYVDRVESTTRVTVYSNLAEAELFANGKSLGKKRASDRFFRFDVPNTAAEMHIIAVAGNCRDESRIRKVDKFNENYRLREKNAILNWFDITEKEDRLSLNDKISDIVAVEEGEALLRGLLAKLPHGKDGAQITQSASMLQMLGGFTLLRLTGMLGMMGIEMTKADLLTLNAKLNEIEKN